MSQEKGKNLDPHLEPQLTLKNHNPGCMWGLLHHFQHNRWHNVVKKLPHKRLIGHGKHSTDQGRSKTRSSSTTTTPDSAIMQENESPDAAKTRENDDVSSVESPAADTKAVVPHKSTMKSRIRALITDDKRRKGRHKRSSTYPIKKPADGPVQAQEKTELSPLVQQGSSNDEPCSSTSSPRDHNVGPTSAITSEESGSCELCDTLLKVNYLKQNELGKQPIRDHTLLHGNSIYAVEPSKRDAIQESKLFMDALDLLNVREEVFLKILQDPTSSLANNKLQFRQSPNLRLGLNKSISFAVTQKRDYASPENPKLEEKGRCVDEKGENGDADEVLVKKDDDHKTGIKGFKNIGARIKHVICDKKKEKEKNRIIKDAVHDKIPCDRDVSKNDAHIVTDFGQSSKRSFKRTTSFSDSFDRYNQLLEISINKDAKDHVSDRLRFKGGGGVDAEVPVRRNPAKLGRIFSLPDLRSYSSTHIDDSANVSPLFASDTSAINVQKPVDLGPNIESQENLLDVGEDFDELVILKNSDSDSSRVLNVEHVLVSSSLDGVSKDDELVILKNSDDDSSRVLSVENELVASKLDEISKDDELVILKSSDSDSSRVLSAENELVASKLDDISKDDELVSLKNSDIESSRELNAENELVASKLDEIISNDDELVNLKNSDIESSRELNAENELVASKVDGMSEDDEFVHEIEVCEDSNSPTIQQDLSYSDQDMIDIDTQESEIHQFYDDLLQTDTKNLADYNYVRDVLELSGFSRDAFLGKWQSAEQLLNPSVFEQVEGCLVGQTEAYVNSDHALLFDMINEVLLGIHERSFCYWPRNLTTLSRLHPLPKGNRVLEEVWAEIKWLLSWRPEGDQAIDEAVGQDMGRGDGWMSLQLDAECVGLKLEDMIFDDLLDETIVE